MIRFKFYNGSSGFEITCQPFPASFARTTGTKLLEWYSDPRREACAFRDLEKGDAEALPGDSFSLLLILTTSTSPRTLLTAQ